MGSDFLVKCRDAHQMIADAYNEEIERRKPPEVKYDAKDFDSLKWETKTGTKGEYQQTTKEANENNEIFQALQKILSEHSGFWQNSSYKYWLHQGDINVIDRRRR